MHSLPNPLIIVADCCRLVPGVAQVALNGTLRPTAVHRGKRSGVQQARSGTTSASTLLGCRYGEPCPRGIETSGPQTSTSGTVSHLDAKSQHSRVQGLRGRHAWSVIERDRRPADRRTTERGMVMRAVAMQRTMSRGLAGACPSSGVPEATSGNSGLLGHSLGGYRLLCHVLNSASRQGPAPPARTHPAELCPGG